MVTEVFDVTPQHKKFQEGEHSHSGRAPSKITTNCATNNPGQTTNRN